MRRVAYKLSACWYMFKLGTLRSNFRFWRWYVSELRGVLSSGCVDLRNV